MTDFGRPPIGEIELFAEVVRHVILGHGFENFVPIVLFPVRNEVRVLDDIRTDADQEAEAFRWVADHARPDEDFLVALKVGPSLFKVVRLNAISREETLFDVVDAKDSGGT